MCDNDKKALKKQNYKMSINHVEAGTATMMIAKAYKTNKILPLEVITFMFMPIGVDEHHLPDLEQLIRAVNRLRLTCKGYFHACAPLINKISNAQMLLLDFGNYNYCWEKNRLSKNQTPTQSLRELHRVRLPSKVIPIEATDVYTSCPALFDLLTIGMDTPYVSYRSHQKVDIDKLCKDAQRIISMYPSSRFFKSGILDARMKVTCFELAIQNYAIPLNFIKMLIEMGMPISRTTYLYADIDLAEFLVKKHPMAYQRLQSIINDTGMGRGD